MSFWRAPSRPSRKGGRDYVLEFAAPAAPAAPPAAAEQLDEDVWAEELPEEAVEEAIQLATQVYTQQQQQQQLQQQPLQNDSVGSHCWEEMELDTEQLNNIDRTGGPPAAGQAGQDLPLVRTGGPPAGAQAGQDRQQLQTEISRLTAENQRLKAEANAARDLRYTQQGEVSVLRSELAQRLRDQEAMRLDNSRKMQEQEQTFETKITGLNRDLDALRTELQFKTHELTEASKQCRILRSPLSGVGSPPRKQARLAEPTAAAAADGSPGTPQSRRGFISRCEFEGVQPLTVRKESSATQTDVSSTGASSVTEPLVLDGPAPCHLVSSVLSACTGEVSWLSGPPADCLSQLAGQPGLTAEAAERTARLLAAAAAGQLGHHLTAGAQLSRSAQQDRRYCTLRSGRRYCSDQLTLLRSELTCVSVLTALRRLAEWPGVSAHLSRSTELTAALTNLLRPLIVQGQVYNVLVMEHSLVLLAELASDTLPTDLMVRLEPAVNEILNTKPPQRLLLAVLQLLTATAGTGQVQHFWCPHRTTAGDRQTGTCLLKKLYVLFCELGAEAGAAAAVGGYSYPVPRSHRQHQPAGAQTRPVAALRGDLRPPELKNWQVRVLPSVEGPLHYRFVRLLALVVYQGSPALPTGPCCLSNLSVLAVRLLHRLIELWLHGDAAAVDVTSSVHHVISCVHRLADLDGEFSASVSRVRLHYLVTMETLALHWKQLNCTEQIVGVLRELYKFPPGTFDQRGSPEPEVPTSTSTDRR